MKTEELEGIEKELSEIKDLITDAESTVESWDKEVSPHCVNGCLATSLHNAFKERDYWKKRTFELTQEGGQNENRRDTNHIYS